MKHQARLCYTSVEKELGLSAQGKHSSRYCSRGGWPADCSLNNFECVSLAPSQSYIVVGMPTNTSSLTTHIFFEGHFSTTSRTFASIDTFLTLCAFRS